MWPALVTVQSKRPSLAGGAGAAPEKHSSSGEERESILLRVAPVGVADRQQLRADHAAMLSIAVASLSFDPPSQIAAAASVSVDPPSQIVLKDALFHVQNYFDGGLFAVGDRHMVSGTASLSGGDLTVKCGSGATGKACPGYSIHLGPGTPRAILGA